MTERPKRSVLKKQAAELLSGARVSPKKMTALYMGLGVILNIIVYLGGGLNLISTFLVVLTNLLLIILDAGFTLYCMAVRRREHAEYLILFDGFSNVGKIILLEIIKYIFISLWSMLFIIPGVIAYYRYRFALYYLLEDPDLGVMEALELSKRQTFGYKGPLFALDFSYLGWALLAGLPDIIYRVLIQRQAMISLMSMPDYAYADFQIILDTISPDVLGIPVLAWRMIILLFALLISLFYLPNYRCVELDYFDAAKSSGPLGKRDSVLWNQNSDDDDHHNSTGNSSFGDFY